MRKRKKSKSKMKNPKNDEKKWKRHKEKMERKTQSSPSLVHNGLPECAGVRPFRSTRPSGYDLWKY
jgi:hypothetical protein